MTETLRAWMEAAETFGLEVINEQRRGKRAALVRSLLYLLSKVFQLGVKVRRFLYKVRILRDSTLGIQVIAIGNLTVGGTGKTPVVEKFARELQKQGRTVAILSRGYRSKPQPFKPGQPAKIQFAMPDVMHTFLPGHRIMVQIQSSWFPLTDRNPQKFLDIATAKASDFQKAVQRVYRGGADGTRLDLLVTE